jgi:hypothetical protein
MECNVGHTDKVIRLVLSAALIVVGIVLWSSAGVVGFIIPAVVAGILTATVRMSWCPIYRVLGLSTCRATA